MPDIQKTVEIIFGARDETDAAVSSAVGRMQEFSRSVEGATQPLADLFATVNNVQLGLVAVAGAAGVWAVRTAADFDASFREIATLINQPLEALTDFEAATLASAQAAGRSSADIESFGGAFRQQVFDAATASAFAMDDFTSSVYAAVSAGVEFNETTGGSEIVEFTQQVERLAIAGRAELQPTMLTLVSTLNAFGLETTEAERVSDLLFTTVRLGQTTLPELSASLSQVTSTAAGTGVPLEELLSGIAALTAAGFPTSQAVTSIRAALANLLRPSSDAAELAGDLGIQFDAAALRSMGFAGVLEQLTGRTDITAAEMGRLFGSVEAINAVIALTGVGAEAFASNIEAMGDSAGATQAAYETMVDSFGIQNQFLINAFRGLLISFADPLLDEVTTLQRGLTSIFAALGDEFDDGGALAPLRDVLEGLLQQFGVFIQSIATNLPAALEGVNFQPLLDALGSVGETFGTLFGGVDLTSVEGLRDAIQLVVNVLANFEEIFASQIATLRGAFGVIEQLVGWFASLDGEATDLIGQFLGFGAQANFVAGAVGNLLTPVGALIDLFTALAVFRIAGNLTAMAGASDVAHAAMTRLGTVMAWVAGPLVVGAVAYGLGTLAYQFLQNRDGFIDLSDAVFGTGERLVALATGTNRFVDTESPAFQDAVQRMTAELRASEDGFVAAETANDRLAQAIASAGGEYEVYGDAVGGLIESLRSGEITTQEFRDNITLLGLDAVSFSRVMGTSATEAELFGTALDGTNDALGSHGLTLAEVEDGVRRLGDNWQTVGGEIRFVLNDVEEATRGAGNSGLEFADTMFDGVQVVQGLYSSTRDVAREQKEELDEAAREAVEYRIALEEIASNERIALIQSRVELDIADVQANAEIVTALLENVADIFDSTVGGINALFGATENPEWDRFGLEARRQLDLYNEILREQLDIQRDTAEAQIAYMNARTQAITRGDAMLQIDGGSLQPHLEAFMWEILRAIQIRVNEDGLEMLLGTPA